MMEERVESYSRPMAPRYHAHAPAVPLPLALPLLALGPGFEKMFRENISTQHMLETFARLALHDDERHGRRVRRGRAATRDVPPSRAVRRPPPPRNVSLPLCLSLLLFLSPCFSLSLGARRCDFIVDELSDHDDESDEEE